jgi:ABC-2 type transport system ATP-binding protein
MRQKLALARSLLHSPPILLLDEPTSAMDPASARLVRESIAKLQSSNRAIVICTHNLSEAEAIADRIAIIQQGEIVAIGDPGELKQAILGDPIMEVRLVENLNGVQPELPSMVKVLQVGASFIRYQVADPSMANPLVLKSLAEGGFSVITLSEVGRSLEEVYLQVVKGDFVNSGMDKW